MWKIRFIKPVRLSLIESLRKNVTLNLRIIYSYFMLFTERIFCYFLLPDFKSGGDPTCRSGHFCIWAVLKTVFTCWCEVALLWGVVLGKWFSCAPKMVCWEEVRYHVPETKIHQFARKLAEFLSLFFTCKVFKIRGHEILDTFVKVDWSVDSPSDWSGTLNCLLARASIFRFCLSSFNALDFMLLTGAYRWKQIFKRYSSVWNSAKSNNMRKNCLFVWILNATFRYLLGCKMVKIARIKNASWINILFLLFQQ